MSARLQDIDTRCVDLHVLDAATLGLTTVYEEGSSDTDSERGTKGGKAATGFQMPPLRFPSGVDDACTDATVSTKTSSRAGNETPLAQDLLAIFESKLQSHKDEVQSYLEQRCGELSTMMFRESDWRRQNVETSMDAYDRRLDRLDALLQERCTDISSALLSESDRWRSHAQKLEDELGIGIMRLYGAECKLWHVERCFQEIQGAESHIVGANDHAEANTLERLQEHIESNSEFIRSFIERESAKIASLSEALRHSDDERLALERKVDDVARFFEDVKKQSHPKEDSTSVISSSSKIFEATCDDADVSSGPIANKKHQRPPVKRTASATIRPGDLLASRGQVRRLQSAPVLAALCPMKSTLNSHVPQAFRSACGAAAEKTRSPDRFDGQKVNPHRSHAVSSGTHMGSPSSMKRRVSPKPEGKPCFK